MPPLNRMWRNNGNGTFTDQTEATGFAAPVPTYAAIGTDYNNDRAIDVVISGWYKGGRVFSKTREKANSFIAEPMGPFFPVGLACLTLTTTVGWMSLIPDSLGKGLPCGETQKARR